MKKLFATLTITLILAAAVVGVNAHQTRWKAKKHQTQNMPMMAQMMGGERGMMGQMPMMGQMKSGMMCPMRKHMMGNMMEMGQTETVDLPNTQTLLAKADELELTSEQVDSLKTVALNAQKESA